MTLLFDESVDGRLVSTIREAGHHVSTVSELMPGASDSEVLQMASDVSTLLVTEDKDFGSLTIRLRRQTSGVLLLRFGDVPIDERRRLLAEALSRYSKELLNSFSVLSPAKLRIRPLP